MSTEKFDLFEQVAEMRKELNELKRAESDRKATKLLKHVGFLKIVGTGEPQLVNALLDLFSEDRSTFQLVLHALQVCIDVKSKITTNNVVESAFPDNDKYWSLRRLQKAQEAGIYRKARPLRAQASTSLRTGTLGELGVIIVPVGS